MKCFKHPQSEAVATCKGCSKGVCTECAKDTGTGIACSPRCEEEVKTIDIALRRNKKAYPIVATAHKRNAIIFASLGVAFATFGLIEGSDSSGFLFSIVSGVIMIMGGAFSLLTARKYSKLSGEQA